MDARAFRETRLTPRDPLLARRVDGRAEITCRRFDGPAGRIESVPALDRIDPKQPSGRAPASRARPRGVPPGSGRYAGDVSVEMAVLRLHVRSERVDDVADGDDAAE